MSSLRKRQIFHPKHYWAYLPVHTFGLSSQLAKASQDGEASGPQENPGSVQIDRSEPYKQSQDSHSQTPQRRWSRGSQFFHSWQELHISQVIC